MPSRSPTAQTAVITGAASGIGRAAARAMAAKGRTVALLDLPGPALDAAAAEIAALSPASLALPCDVSDASQMAAAAAKVAASLPPVTYLMNNAGMGLPSTTLAGLEAWMRTLGVNLWGVIHGTQAFAPAMLAHGLPGRIVNTGSKQGITTPPGNPAYNVSKAGVKAFTEALAHELRTLPEARITAHLLIPGWVHTGLTAASGTPKPPGAWTPDQTVDFMLEALDRGDFYILCPDNETPRALDVQRIAWAAGDITENRPALSRWHPAWSEVFKAGLKKD